MEQQLIQLRESLMHYIEELHDRMDMAGLPGCGIGRRFRDDRFFSGSCTYCGIESVEEPTSRISAGV